MQEDLVQCVQTQEDLVQCVQTQEDLVQCVRTQEDLVQCVRTQEDLVQCVRTQDPGTMLSASVSEVLAYANEFLGNTFKGKVVIRIQLYTKLALEFEWAFSFSKPKHIIKRKD
ncbi:hypothetical protein STEG23_033125 [Scotinomys teguina]